MAQRTLARTVTVQKYKGEGRNRVPVGEPRTFAKGDQPPAEWAEFITNPSAWEGGSDRPTASPSTGSAAAPRPAKRTARKAAARTATAATGDGDSAGGNGDGDLKPPDGDDVAEWREYASKVGVTVPEDADLEQVKAALADKGLLDS